MESLRSSVRITFYAILFSTVVAVAQQPSYMTEVGPVPPALSLAKTIFVSNAGSDSGLFPEPFTGDPNRTYSEFYYLLHATGAFELVSDPAQADIVVELRLTAPYGPIRYDKSSGTADPLPMFRLVVYDRKTHYILWTENQSIDSALTQKNHDRNFDEALRSILRLFLQASGKSLSGPTAASR